jgi:hypothetical protein
MLHLVPAEFIEKLLPTSQGGEQVTYVPASYTNERPLISQKRVISGLLSIVIVALLVCVGAGYGTKASGKIEEFTRFIAGVPPASIQNPGITMIRDPKREPDRGPAANIISSATTTSRLDPLTHIAVASEQLFQLNQSVYVTYTVKPTGKGIVTIKWYTNKIMYAPSEIKVDPEAGNVANGYAEMRFIQPAEGYVELYWNNQLAQRLYFAVRA